MLSRRCRRGSSRIYLVLILAVGLLVFIGLQFRASSLHNEVQRLQSEQRDGAQQLERLKKRQQDLLRSTGLEGELAALARAKAFRQQLLAALGDEAPEEGGLGSGFADHFTGLGSPAY